MFIIKFIKEEALIIVLMKEGHGQFSESNTFFPMVCEMKAWPGWCGSLMLALFGAAPPMMVGKSMPVMGRAEHAL